MNYETAQKLHKAGFPEITRWGAEHNVHRYHSMEQEPISFPDIGELIAEIEILQDGKQWGLISGHMKSGYTCYNGSAEGYWENETEGVTPEESLAMLWLALHGDKV